MISERGGVRISAYVGTRVNPPPLSHDRHSRHLSPSHLSPREPLPRLRLQMFIIMTGEFDYEAYQASESVVGPYLFLSFMSIYILIILNMVVAIMEKAFNEVKQTKAADKAREPALLAARHTIVKLLDRLALPYTYPRIPTSTRSQTLTLLSLPLPQHLPSC